MMLDRVGTHTDSHIVDPKHYGFVRARYKFVAKMLTGFDRVLEVGCGDCSSSDVVSSVVRVWRGIDNEPYPGALIFDILSGPPSPGWDAIYALDVLEHIDPRHEDIAMQNMAASLNPHGVCIIGMPSLESQAYASESSKLHHVNCKTEDGLRGLMQRHFCNVFMFGMNDEVLHTGFGPMCHYRFAIGTGKR